MNRRLRLYQYYCFLKHTEQEESSHDGRKIIMNHGWRDRLRVASRVVDGFTIFLRSAKCSQLPNSIWCKSLSNKSDVKKSFHRKMTQHKHTPQYTIKTMRKFNNCSSESLTCTWGNIKENEKFSFFFHHLVLRPHRKKTKAARLKVIKERRSEWKRD